MSNPADDLAGRVSALEGEVARLRDKIALSTADSTGARLLAAGADREVSDMRAQLRAHTRVLNALRQTQLEQGQDLAALRDETRSEFGAVRGEIRDLRTEMRTEFTDVRSEIRDLRTEMRTEIGELRSDMHTGFATLQAGMTQIVGLLEQIGPDPSPA